MAYQQPTEVDSSDNLGSEDEKQDWVEKPTNRFNQLSSGQLCKEIISLFWKNKHTRKSQDNEEIQEITLTPKDKQMCFKMAEAAIQKLAIDGFDKSDVVYKNFEKVKSFIKSSDFEAAERELIPLKQKRLVFDMQDFFDLYEETKQTQFKLKKKTVLVLLGPTGAGKSTSIHFLFGSDFETQGATKVVKRVNDKNLKKITGIKVGGKFTKSETRFISGVKLDLDDDKYELNNDEERYDDILLVDSPGFEDSSGAEVNISNGIGTIEALQKADKVKVIITMAEGHSETRFQAMKGIASNLGQCIRNLSDKFKQRPPPFVGILTKSGRSKEEFLSMIKGAAKEQKKDEDRDFLAFLRSFDSKTAPVKLHHIKIKTEKDDENYKEENEKLRKSIIESIFNESGYIDDPNDTFRKFVSDSSAAKLKEQLNIDLRSIQNILGNNEYFKDENNCQFIVNLIKNLEKLLSIIKKAGGNFIESTLMDYKNTLKDSWNEKMNDLKDKMSDINNIDTSLLNKRLNEFEKSRKEFIKCDKVFKQLDNKFYSELTDINYLDVVIAEIFESLSLKVKKLFSVEDSKEEELEKDLSCLDKICLFYGSYKINTKIKEEFENLKKYVRKSIVKQINDCDGIIDDTNLHEESHIKNLILKLNILSSSLEILQKLNKCLKKSNNDEIPSLNYELKQLSNKIKRAIENKANRILIKYAIDEIDFNDEIGSSNSVISDSINLNAEISKIIGSFPELESEFKERTKRLNETFNWLKQVEDGIVRIRGYDIEEITNLKQNCASFKDKFLKSLKNLCINQLTYCRQNLLNPNDESTTIWKNINKLIKNSKSLRTIDEVNRVTSNLYYGVVNDYDKQKTSIADEIRKIIDSIETGSLKKEQLEKIMKSVNKLTIIGLTSQSPEIQTIKEKITEHLDNLKQDVQNLVLFMSKPNELANIKTIIDELQYLSKLKNIIPDIENDSIQLYEYLHEKLFKIIEKISKEFDLKNFSTEKIKLLLKLLQKYLETQEKIKKKHENISNLIKKANNLNNLLQKYQNDNEKLHQENTKLTNDISKNSSSIKEKIALLEKSKEKIKKFIEMEDDGAVTEELEKIGFKSLTEQSKAMKELKEKEQSIGVEEKKKIELNNKMIEENKIVIEQVELYLRFENELSDIGCNDDNIIGYRKDVSSIKTKMDELTIKLKGDPKYIFDDNINLYNSYNATLFIQKCRKMRWNGFQILQKNDNKILSMQFIEDVARKLKDYLSAYGNNLETNFVESMEKCSLTNINNIKLSDEKFRGNIEETIKKISLLLTELREIATYVHFNDDDDDDDDNNDSKEQDNANLVKYIFKNIKLKNGKELMDWYSGKINDHKESFKNRFEEWKTATKSFLPLLHWMCIMMSCLDRYVNNKDSENTYSALASIINTEITKTASDSEKKVIPAFEKHQFGQLRRIFDDLKKNSSKESAEGPATRSYKESVLKIYGLQITAIQNVRQKLFSDISTGVEIKDENIMNLNNDLKSINEGVLLLGEHLSSPKEKKKLQDEENRLNELLIKRTKEIKISALNSVKNKDFIRCSRMIKNMKALKDAEPTKTKDIDEKEEIKEIESVEALEITMHKEIQEELNSIREEVKDANEKMLKTDGNSHNPYSPLRLQKLFEQIEKSDVMFQSLEVDITREIETTLVKLFNKINTNQFSQDQSQKLSYQEEQIYTRKINSAMNILPKIIVNNLETAWEETKELVEKSSKIEEDLQKHALDNNSWKDLAIMLIETKKTSFPRYTQIHNSLVVKIRDLVTEFQGYRKDESRHKLIIDQLEEYKNIGLCLTNLKYNDSIKETEEINEKICINNVQTSLKDIYRGIVSLFEEKCNNIRDYLQMMKQIKPGSNFKFINSILQYKLKIPIDYQISITQFANSLCVPIQKCLEQLNQNKKDGFSEENNDFDKLCTLLNRVKDLTDDGMFIEMMDFQSKFKSKNLENIKQDVQNIEYKTIKEKAKEQLKQFKNDIVEQGIGENIVDKDSNERKNEIQKISSKITTLIKSKDLASKHFGIKEDSFKNDYLQPCTSKIKEDCHDLKKQIEAAFKNDDPKEHELKKANGIIETLGEIGYILEKDPETKKTLKEAKITELHKQCKNMAVDTVNELQEKLSIPKNISNDDLDGEIGNLSVSLIKLKKYQDYLNFDDAQNKQINKSIDECFKQFQEMFLRKKVGVFAGKLSEVDPTHGGSIIAQQAIFEAHNIKQNQKKYHDKSIFDIIASLEKSGKIIQSDIKQNLESVQSKFNEIDERYQKFDEYLKGSSTYDKLKEKMSSLKSDTIFMAEKAIKDRDDKLTQFWKKVKIPVATFLRWALQLDPKDYDDYDPRKMYWINSIRKIVPELTANVLMMWTLLNSKCYYGMGDQDNDVLLKPRRAQIVAVLSILSLDYNQEDIKNDDEKGLVNNLVEVGTGEGKSLIMAVTSCVLALLGFDVYCACYSKLLSERDKKEYDELFSSFGVSQYIKYNTFDEIFEEMINANGDIRQTAKNVVTGNHSQTYQKQENDPTKVRPKILFIDEVDKFFSIDFFGNVYSPSAMIQSDEIKDLLNELYIKFKKGEIIDLDLEWIKNSKEYASIMNKFDKEWHELLEESFKDMIDGIRTFEEIKDYRIEKGRDIAYKLHDSYSTKVFYGYKTMFHYIDEYNKRKITNDQHVTSKLGWFIKCGQFLYSEIPYRFFAILGVTGTLLDLTEKQHDIMKNTYKIRKCVKMPSLFDKTDKLNYSKDADISIVDENEFFKTLHGHIMNRQNNGNNDEYKRPIIVFFKDKLTLLSFYENEVCKLWKIEKRIQILKPDLTSKEKKNRIILATKANMITFATEEFGRGIDYKVHDNRFASTGLHIELTYWPDTKAEETQIKGRTARQGERGSFHIILNKDEIMDIYGIEEKEIEDNHNRKELYTFLDKKREQVFKKRYEEAEACVKAQEHVHKHSEALAEALRTKEIPKAQKLLLEFNRGAILDDVAKLSILIDATGSMCSCLTQCKTVINNTLPLLTEFLQKNGIGKNSFQLQIIAYRNYSAPSNELILASSFSNDTLELTRFLNDVKAKYGLGAEAVEVAFSEINRATKKPNIVLLIADAPAQSQGDIKRKQKHRGIDYWNTEQGGKFKDMKYWRDQLDNLMKEKPKTKVYCFYLKDWAKENFTEIATIGNGTAKYLNVKNAEESVKKMTAALSEPILATIKNGDMSLVKEFRKQNKNLPTFL